MNTTIIMKRITKILSSINPKSKSPVNNEQIYAEGKNKEGFEKLMVRFGKNEEELHRMIAALNKSL